MRNPALLTLVLLTACGLFDGSDDGFSFDDSFGLAPNAVSHSGAGMQHRSAAFADAEGVAPDDADTAWVGMVSMVCQVSMSDGTIQLDEDPDPQRPETVVDQTDDHVLTVSDGSIARFNKLDGFVAAREWPGVIDAALGRDGEVIVLEADDDCEIVFGTWAGAPSVPVADEACAEPQLSLDPDTLTAIIVTDDGVETVTSEGAEAHPAKGDIAVWDADAGVLYTAFRGTETVDGWTLSGEHLWQASVGGGVKQIRAGRKALVLVERASGDAVVAIDAASGEVSELGTVHANVRDLSVSPSGTRIAVTTRGQVDFFAVE